MKTLLCCLLLALPLSAQRDFLTADEIDRSRKRRSRTCGSNFTPISPNCGSIW